MHPWKPPNPLLPNEATLLCGYLLSNFGAKVSQSTFLTARLTKGSTLTNDTNDQILNMDSKGI